MPGKKIFYFNNDERLKILAGGIILYRMKKNDIELLLIDSHGNFEDLGGKSEKDDEEIYDMIAREAHEESNYLLDKESIKSRLKESYCSYITHSKYIVYLVEATKEEAELTTEKFGEKEIHTDIQRQIRWIPLKVFLNKNIIKHKVTIRLKNNNFFDMVRNVKKNMAEWDILQDTIEKKEKVCKSNILENILK